MAITFTDGWAMVIRFDWGWELELVHMDAFVFGVCMGFLLTWYWPDLADRLRIYTVVAVVAAFQMIKSLLVFPVALDWA